MKKTPPTALSISCATLSAPIRASFSPVVSMKASLLRTPSSFSRRPRSLATVVLPVPGLPSSAKLRVCGTRRSAGNACSRSTRT
eukprot:5462537-Prymnesium_polylepis.2